MRHRREERAEAIALALAAERVRAIEAERAVLAERLHIARELHDVVSHTLSVIAVQSGSARHRLERGDAGEPAKRAVPALSAIEAASRGALEDLRRMLGLLRADLPADLPAEAPPTSPALVARTAVRPQSPVREWLVDTTLALVLAALGVAFALVRDPALSFDYRPPSPSLVALILLGCLPLAVRRIINDPTSAGVRVVMLTTFGLDEYVFGALRAGATGFLLKDTPPEDLLRAVRAAATGDALLSPPITRRLIEAFATTPPPAAVPAPAFADLTDREADVLRLVAQGLTNIEISDALRVGPATVKTYVSRLLTKLGLTTRVHLVIYAYETAFVPRRQQ